MLQSDPMQIVEAEDPVRPKAKGDITLKADVAFATRADPRQGSQGRARRARRRTTCPATIWQRTSCRSSPDLVSPATRSRVYAPTPAPGQSGPRGQPGRVPAAATTHPAESRFQIQSSLKLRSPRAGGALALRCHSQRKGRFLLGATLRCRNTGGRGSPTVGVGSTACAAPSEESTTQSALAALGCRLRENNAARSTHRRAQAREGRPDKS